MDWRSLILRITGFLLLCAGLFAALVGCVATAMPIPSLCGASFVTIVFAIPVGLALWIKGRSNPRPRALGLRGHRLRRSTPTASATPGEVSHRPE